MRKIKQPTPEQQELLNDIISDSVDTVPIPGTKKTYKIKWIRWGARRKITQIMQSKKEEDQTIFLYKIAACITLNGYWRIKFLYWWRWRWLAYIRQYSEAQLSPIIETAKKKVPAETFLITTISAIGMKDLMMTMTKAEAEHTLQELRSEQLTQQAKNDPGSTPPSPQPSASS